MAVVQRPTTIPLNLDDDLAIPADALPMLPPGPYVSSTDHDEDDVLLLEEAPKHLRKVTNEHAPIAIDDSEDEMVPGGGTGRVASRIKTRGCQKNKAVNSVPASSWLGDKIARQRVSDSSEEDYAPGPSARRGSGQLGRMEPVVRKRSVAQLVEALSSDSNMPAALGAFRRSASKRKPSSLSTSDGSDIAESSRHPARKQRVGSPSKVPSSSLHTAYISHSANRSFPVSKPSTSSASGTGSGLASPQRERRRRSPVKAPTVVVEKTMTIQFDDEDEPMEVPLGWGGLGVPAPNAEEARRLPADLPPDEDVKPVVYPAKAVERPSVDRQGAGSIQHARPAADPFPDAIASGPADHSDKVGPLNAPPNAEAGAPSDGPAMPQPHQPVQPKTAAELLPLVLEIIPDLCPAWALRTLAARMALGQEDPIAQIITLAFERDGGYPKAGESEEKDKSNDKGKGKEGAASDGNAYKHVEYRKEQRRGIVYTDRCQEELEELFPTMPVPFIRNIYNTSKQFVPTYFTLQQRALDDPKLFTELKRPRTRKVDAKGKGRDWTREYGEDWDHDWIAAGGYPLSEGESEDGLCQDFADPDHGGEPEFEREKAWLDAYRAKIQAEADAAKAKELARAEAFANGAGVECGCCFGEEILEDMFQCSEGHLFCRECATTNAETKLGDQQHAILCMDMSACTAHFTDMELARFLTVRSLDLYHRLKQAAEIELAALDGLESCPSCPFAAVIDNAEEKLFRCMNPECGQVTCRKCRKKEHIPKTCEEVEADRKLDKRHAVEDAMSEALIRRCPQCEKPFVKETGCNKISCLKCGAISCYVCRKEITDGYAHFDQNYRKPRAAGKCVLWDKDEAHAEQAAIVAARDAAQIEVRRAAEDEGVELGADDLNVAAPAAPPGRARLPEIPPPVGYDLAMEHAAREALALRARHAAIRDRVRREVAAEDHGQQVRDRNAQRRRDLAAQVARLEDEHRHMDARVAAHEQAHAQALDQAQLQVQAQVEAHARAQAAWAAERHAARRGVRGVAPPAPPPAFAPNHAYPPIPPIMPLPANRAYPPIPLMIPPARVDPPLNDPAWPPRRAGRVRGAPLPAPQVRFAVDEPRVRFEAGLEREVGVYRERMF